MRGTFRVPMAVIAGALLGLIALLATFQYKWLGQISGAERERMTVTLNTRASAFAQDFDRELTRAYLLFQLTMSQDDEGIAAGVMARYDRWQATARFPRMIKDVYLVPSAAVTSGTPRVQRFNPTTRFLEPAEWPTTLADVRAQLVRSAAPTTSSATSSAGATLVMRSMVPSVWPSIPALVVSSPMVMLSHLPGSLADMRMAPDLRYAVLLLDADYIKTEMLPALAQQHFRGTGDGFDYKLAVLPSEGTNPVYHSVQDFSPAPDAQVDAKIDLFQVRVQDFGPLAAEVSRFATFTTTVPRGNGRRGQTIIRQTIGSPHDGAAMGSGSPNMSFVVQTGNTPIVKQGIDQLIAGAGAAMGTRINVPAPAHWRLLVKHPSGSLEQAVNTARRRNLLVSTSILGILGLSVGFLVVSTRRAQDLARQQLEFVATVSHELRTPLAVIRSAADNLADGVVNDEARIRQYGQLVRREGRRLTDLVEQILEFAGLQSGQRKMTARPVAIAPLLRDVVADADGAARAAGVTIELAIDENLPAAAGDEPALRRVFQNLIGNAVKYGADAGWVGVRARLSGGSLEVGVSDRGIGIAAADQPRIFDPFYRAPVVVAAQIQGAGLGLSLVKRIVEAHGGSVGLESAPGAGSTFTVFLPPMSGAAAANASPVEQAAPQPS
jgi:signal transduction histidine kinase